MRLFLILFLAGLNFIRSHDLCASLSEIVGIVLESHSPNIESKLKKILHYDLNRAISHECEGFFSRRSLLESSSVDSLDENDASDDDDEEDDNFDLNDSVFHSNDSILLNAMMVAFLLFCAAMAAGLTMGLVSIDPLEMAIKLRSGREDEVKYAKRILPIVSKHHHLLVSLLLFNSLANEAMPIFLENLFTPMVAVVISVTLILFVGEILPSAIFTGPNQLKIASALSPFVSAIMFIFTPVSWPLGKLLDFMLGSEDLKRYNRAEISALMEVQRDLSRKHHESFCDSSYRSIDAIEEEIEGPLHEDEISIVQGALKVVKTVVKDIMVPMERVYCLSMDQKLDMNCLASIIAGGYSRIPIYEGDNTRNIRGYIQVKKLIALEPDDCRVIRTLFLREPQFVSPQMNLLELFNIFKHGRSHIALVSDDPTSTRAAIKRNLPLEGNLQPTGIISLEDIIETILQQQIEDESDLLVNAREVRARNTIEKYWRRRSTGEKKESAKSTSSAYPLIRCLNLGDSHAKPHRAGNAEKKPLHSCPYPSYGIV